MDYKKFLIAALSLTIGFGTAYLFHKKGISPFTYVSPDPYEPVVTCDTCGWNVTVVVQEIKPGGRPGEYQPVAGASVTLTCVDRTLRTDASGKAEIPYSNPCNCEYEDVITATLGERTITMPMRVKCGGYSLVLP